MEHFKTHKKSAILNHNIHPIFFRLAIPEDETAFQKLLNTHDYLSIHDEIDSQIRELLKIRNPGRKFTEEESNIEIIRHLGGVSKNHYGVWVYYPWSGRLVHLLDEVEFSELRTARNHFKITPEEQLELSKKIIGIIGLSVGQSVALTLAMERSCGELRIADFDDLELSNLNRIRTGLHNLGIPKVVATAREIAEIDPFIKVICYPEGITEENIDDFIAGGQNLDVLIDECDGVDIKVLCREKARSYKVPVLMEASDRCTVDIERFDLEPERPIFHGRVPDLSYQLIKGKTKEEILPYIFPIAGIDTLSERMKYSLNQIGKTITTWPQLASAVVMGGGVTADISRRICLGQLSVSGRFFIDLEELIKEKNE